jgi:hypothetical protein
MDTARALADISELASAVRERSNTKLEYNLDDDQAVELTGITFPKGWTNDSGGRRGGIRFDLPEEYPRYPPSVSIPAEMRFEGDRPVEMAPPKQYGTEVWTPFDPGLSGWDPDTSSLLTMLGLVQTQLESPHFAEV